jgi:hypothetical protein
LDELGGKQLNELMTREKGFTKKWTAADEADLVKRKKSATEQTLLQDIEKLIEGTDVPIYSMKGKLTKAGKENATKTIHNIDEMLDELAYGDKFDFLGSVEKPLFPAGITKQNLIARLQAKSSEIQERLTKSGVKLPEEIKSRGTIYKDITGETQGIALGWSKEDLKLLDKAMHKGIMESEAMKKAGLDPSKASDFYKWEKMKEEWLKKKTGKKVLPEAQKVIEGVKKDPLNIRIMKNFDQPLDDVGLAKEGYNVQEINVLKKARKRMETGEETHPNEALLREKELLADEAGVEIDELTLDIDWGDFTPEPFATGGRVGFKKGGIANRNMIATLFE